MAHWGQPQQPQFRPRANNGYRQPPIQHNYIQQHGPPQPQRPMQLKRQASDLKSYYINTKWCAVYLNTNTSPQQSSNWNDDNVDITTPIPQTNIYLPMDLEDNLIAEIQMYIDEEKELQDKLAQSKSDINAAKLKKEKDKNDKIDTYLTFTSTTDRDKARAILEKNDWDLQKAAAQKFASSSNVFSEGGGGGGGVNNNNNPNNAYNNNIAPNNNNKAIIRMILPDNRQYTYQMDGSDTFWGVYGRLLQSVPELTQKPFSLELQNGHILNENEFDQTLVHAKLVPRGDIRIKY